MMTFTIGRWPFWPLCLCLLPACTFSSKTQHKLFQQIEHRQFDAIIVPGVPFQNNHWDRTMKGRVYWSKYLYDHGIAKNIIYSGGAVYSPYYEGRIMALYAAAIGIPKEHIYEEIRAEHTTENVYYSYLLARKLGFSSIALASDPFQTKMMRRYVRKKFDPPLPLIPFVTDSLLVMEPEMKDPEIDFQQAFKKDFVSITERESFRKRWRGTRGKNIDSTYYK